METNKKLLIASLLTLVIVGAYSLMTSFQGAPPPTPSVSPTVEEIPLMKVTASFYPLSFFAKGIAGDKADVENITPATAEPHDYEPTAGDLARIEDSSLLILNGAGLEPWGTRVTQNLNSEFTFVVNAGDGLTNLVLDEDGKNVIDPHIWQSPVIAKKMVDKIAQGFKDADPENAPLYSLNAAALETKLDVLDASYKAGLQNCAQKNIITSHAAFGYLAATYGFTQVPISGLSPDSEPSAKELSDITKLAKTKKIKYIFFESLVSPKLSETIAQEVGAKTLVLDPIEGITESDSNAGKNYFTIMQQNLQNLRIALECK